MTQGTRAENRFEDVTWTTGIPISSENASQIFSRYRLAADFAGGRRVLELGCGAGQGFGLVGRNAVSLVGADFSTALLRSAKDHYGARVPLVRLSAESLPFEANSFDLVLFFEATYYVPDMERAFDEIARVLAPNGRALFSNHNPEHPSFICSPHSHRYHSADEFRTALERRGFHVTVEGVFRASVAEQGIAERARAGVLHAARSGLKALGLVPRTLRGRARLKRLVSGKLIDVPPELPEDFAAVAPREAVPKGPLRDYRAFYVDAVRIAAK
jgi:SAM-dependent methyltransferase